MTPEAQRVAIAKACGWKNLQKEQYYWMGTPPDGSDLRVTYKRHTLPNYLNDLNAMHEAVMGLDFEQRAKFRLNLQFLVAPETKPSRVTSPKLMGYESYNKWFHATASQRAEAFLRTLGLWTDTKGS